MILKLKLAYRSLGDHRLAISVFLLALASVIFYQLILSTQLTDTHAMMGCALIPLLLLQYHIQRNDQDFLQLQIGTTYVLLVLEYLLWTIPPMVLFLFKGFSFAWFLWIPPFVIPLIPSINTPVLSGISPFGKGNVEWNSGLRISMVFQILFLILFIGSCILRLNFAMSVALLALNLISFAAYYNIFEKDYMIIAYRNSKELLHSKIMFALKNMFIVSILLCVILILSYQQFEWYVLMIVAQGILLTMISLLVKYTYYPNKMASELQMAILFFMTVIPFTAPIVLLLCFAFYKKARAKLNPYFPYDISEKH